MCEMGFATWSIILLEFSRMPFSSFKSFSKQSAWSVLDYELTVTDDFVAVGFGDTVEEVANDHDRNLLAFLAKMWRVKPIWG